MALDFDWSLFQRAQDAKNRNSQEMNQNMVGLGQNLGQGFNTIGQAMQEHKKRQIIQQLVQAMQQQGQPKPPIQGPSGYVPPNQSPGAFPPVPAGQVPPGPQDNSQKINSLLMQYDPQSAMKQMDPLKQAQIEWYKRRASGGSGSKPMGSIYRNMATGELTDDPSVAQGPEWKQYKTTEGDVLNKLTGQTSGKNKAEAGSVKDLNKDWDELQKTVNPFKPSGFGAASSVFAKAANANRAAASGVKLLRKPTLTWKELNAYVNSDFANLQRGGSPTDIQLSEANYTNLMSKVGKLKEFVNSQPATGLVNPETRKQMEENFKELINIDNSIIDDALDYAQTAHPRAISAFPSRWNNLKKNAEKIKTLVSFGDAGGGSKFDADKEARYQEWKKSNGY